MLGIKELLEDNGIDQSFLDGIPEDDSIACVFCDSLRSDDRPGGKFTQEGWMCYKCLE